MVTSEVFSQVSEFSFMTITKTGGRAVVGAKLHQLGTHVDQTQKCFMTLEKISKM